MKAGKPPLNQGLESLRKAIKLIRNYQETPDVKMRNIIKLTERAEIEFRRILGARAEKGRSGNNITYSVENVREMPMLTERRKGASQPIRVSYAIYTGVARSVSELERPMKVQDIVNRAASEVDVPAEFQVRLLLRFWTRGPEPILRREKAHYVSTDPAKFEQQAERLWIATRYM